MLPYAKLFFFDLETTGVDHTKHGLTQISGKIVINKVEVERFNWHVRPYDGCEIDEEALAATHLTKEEVMQYPTEAEIYPQVEKMLDKYVSKFDKKDKFFMVGYNVSGFDNVFFRDFFERNGNKYFGSYFWSVPLDVMIKAQFKLVLQRDEMPDFKQGTVAKQLGIPVDDEKLHDATYDIDICHEIFKKVVV